MFLKGANYMESHPSKNSNKLTRSTESLKAVLSWLEMVNDHIAIIIWNDDKEVIYVSNNFKDITDLKPIEMYGYEWLTAYSKEATDEINLILNEQKHKETETIKECHYNGRSIRYTYGKIEVNGHYYLICQLKHISYITQLEKKLSKLQQGLIHLEKMAITGEFSAGLVHEIRNPLTSLKGFLQLVQAGIDQKEQYYNVMIQEIEKIESITTELLTMSRPFKERRRNELLKEMIEDTIIIMKLQTKFNRLSFEVNCNDTSYIYCNKQEIKQVLINLLKNAAEAMNMQGKIIVNVFETEETVILQVIDEGKGVSRDAIYEIGKPFYTTKESGTGLGLVITKEILKLHHATLNISSQSGQGSKFEIVFPRNE